MSKIDATQTLATLAPANETDEVYEIESYEMDMSDYFNRLAIYPTEDGKCLVAVSFWLGLDWHAELEKSIVDSTPANAPKAREYFIWDGDSYTLKDEAFDALNNIIRNRYNGEYIDSDGSAFTWDETFTVPDTMTVEDLGVYIWEHTSAVQILNESDPGSFGSPYLFGSLMTDALEELEDTEESTEA